MTPRPGPFVALVATLLALAGCGSPALTPPGPTSGSASGSALPPRPRSLPVADLDPCRLVPPASLTQDRLPVRGTSKPPPPATPLDRTCTWTNFPTRPALTLTVLTIVDQDIDRLLSYPGAVPASVAGFGAIDMADVYSTPEESCGVRLDVAPRQQLVVSYDVDYGRLPGQSHQFLCAKAHTTAEAIIQRLSATAN